MPAGGQLYHRPLGCISGARDRKLRAPRSHKTIGRPPCVPRARRLGSGFMAKVTVRRVVPGSQERVWHVLSDLDRFPEWLPNLERVEHRGGPARGLIASTPRIWPTAPNSTRRSSPGTTPVGLAGASSASCVAVPRSAGITARARISICAPSGADTEMSITSSWRPSGPIAWLKSFMTGGVQSEHEAALSNFAALLESPASDKADSSA